MNKSVYCIEIKKVIAVVDIITLHNVLVKVLLNLFDETFSWISEENFIGLAL